MLELSVGQASVQGVPPPTKPIAIVYRQYGGKASIAKWIASHFPPHRVYMEPFCGSCSVLFAKPRSFVEIANDLDGRIISMYRHMRESPERLAALLWATPCSKANWRDFAPEEGSLEDACLLMAQGAQFYCGNGNSSTWAIDKCGAPHKPKPEVWADWFLRILPAAARLRTVQILCEDGIDAIRRVHMQEDALIYVDPPYLGHEGEYRHAVDYERLVGVLREAKARVVVSEYPEAAVFYGGWRQERKDTAGRTRTGAHNTTAKAKAEMLFMNF
jgi:DNA adenine methylase